VAPLRQAIALTNFFKVLVFYTMFITGIHFHPSLTLEGTARLLPYSVYLDCLSLSVTSTLA
jgi:hypothetical protein